MYMLKVTSSHQSPVFQYNTWVLCGLLTFCIYKFLVQQWKTWLPLTPTYWLLCSTCSMIPGSCLHCCHLRSPLLHVFPLPYSGLGAAPPAQERESRGTACYSEEGYFNGQDSRQTRTAILGSSLGDLKTQGDVSLPRKLRGKCWSYFIYVPQFMSCEPAPKTWSSVEAGAAPEALGRVAFRPKRNSHLTDDSWSRLKVGKRKPFLRRL